MKYFQILVFFCLTSVCMKSSYSDQILGFVIPTAGLHVSPFFADPYIGGTGFLGYFSDDEEDYENLGIGILGSHNYGLTNVEGYTFKSRINNLMFASGILLRDGHLVIAASGITWGTLTLGDRTESGRGESGSIIYIHQFDTGHVYALSPETPIKIPVGVEVRWQGGGFLISSGIAIVF